MRNMFQLNAPIIGVLPKLRLITHLWLITDMQAELVLPDDQGTKDLDNWNSSNSENCSSIYIRNGRLYEFLFLYSSCTHKYCVVVTVSDTLFFIHSSIFLVCVQHYDHGFNCVLG